MSPQQPQRYMRTERPGTGDAAPRVDPEVERFEEERARYGSFAVILVSLLVLATIVAIVGAVVFWPD